MTSTAELLEWHAVADRQPDSDITVLMWVGVEWFSGWLDADGWHDAASGALVDDVTHWAEPEGPATCKP